MADLLGATSSDWTISTQPYIIPPTSAHKYTVIAMHGLGSTGRIFADRLLFGAPYSETPTLSTQEQFASWTGDLPVQNIRFVFPTAPLRDISVGFKRRIPAWFEISSFTDLEYKQEQQMAGLQESVEHLASTTRQETALLQSMNQPSRNLFVIGRSQGSSVTGWALMTGHLAGIGGVVLAGSWLILARALRASLVSTNSTNESTEPPISDQCLSFAQEMIESGEPILNESKPPVLMGHSTDDEWINVKLGRQFRDVLEIAGYAPVWQEYMGAEEEGHWFKDPEELERMARFLRTRMK